MEHMKPNGSASWLLAACIVTGASAANAQTTPPATTTPPAAVVTPAAPAPAEEAPPPGYWINGIHLSAQIQGGIMQSASWTLYEQVDFDKNAINSTDWSTYPIMRFSTAPDSVDVFVIDRPGQPSRWT